MNITRQPSWAATGIDITEAKTAAEALELSGLNYEVVKAPVYLSNGYKIPNQFCTKKKNTNEIFGIVGKDFTIVQNNEAFSFIDALASDGLNFVRAGETTWMNWIIASLPSSKILGDDVTPYVIFQNSHTGGSTLKASISPLRMICSNQFTIAWREAVSKVALKHTASIIDRLDSAAEVMMMTEQYMHETNKQAEVLATSKLDSWQIDKIVEAVFPLEENAGTRKQNSVIAARAAFNKAYNEEDLLNFRGTKWGMLNAYSDFITHKEPGRKTVSAYESKFISVSMNPAIMESFMRIMNAV